MNKETTSCVTKIKYIMFIIHDYAVFYLALFGFWYFTHTWKALE